MNDTKTAVVTTTTPSSSVQHCWIDAENSLEMIPLEEGRLVSVVETKRTWKCVCGYLGQLVWQVQAATRKDFPEVAEHFAELDLESEDEDHFQELPELSKIIWGRACPLHGCVKN